MKDGFVLAAAIVCGVYINYKRFQHKFTPRQVEKLSRRRTLLSDSLHSPAEGIPSSHGEKPNALTVPG